MKKSHIVEIFIFAILTGALIMVGAKVFKHSFDIGKTYQVAFHDIDSIVIGSPVRILGVDVGHVTKIKPDYDKINVDFIITNPDIELPQGTKATIEFFGIAGSRSIELSPPNENPEGSGIITREPIRIGDAFSIMEEFLKATMASISGLSEFAKNRTQADVAKDTDALLKTTNETDDKIVALTSEIEKGGAKIRESITGTTNGMTRVFNDISVFNLGENYNKAKFGIKATKRSLSKIYNNIKDLNQLVEYHFDNYNISYDEFKEIKLSEEMINQFDKTFEDISAYLQKVDENLSPDNIDQILNSTEEIKNKTAELEQNL